MPTVPFQSGSPMMVIGPTNCGKTYWINRLLENDMFTQPVASILYCYGVYQDFYNQMHNNPSIGAPLHFHKGLSSQEDIDNLYDGEFHIIVLALFLKKVIKNVHVMIFVNHDLQFVTFNYSITFTFTYDVFVTYFVHSIMIREDDLKSYTWICHKITQIVT